MVTNYHFKIGESSDDFASTQKPSSREWASCGAEERRRTAWMARLLAKCSFGWKLQALCALIVATPLFPICSQLVTRFYLLCTHTHTHSLIPHASIFHSDEASAVVGSRVNFHAEQNMYFLRSQSVVLLLVFHRVGKSFDDASPTAAEECRERASASWHTHTHTGDNSLPYKLSASFTMTVHIRDNTPLYNIHGRHTNARTIIKFSTHHRTNSCIFDCFVCWVMCDSDFVIVDKCQERAAMPNATCHFPCARSRGICFQYLQNVCVPAENRNASITREAAWQTVERFNPVHGIYLYLISYHGWMRRRWTIGKHPRRSGTTRWNEFTAKTTDRLRSFRQFYLSNVDVIRIPDDREFWISLAFQSRFGTAPAGQSLYRLGSVQVRIAAGRHPFVIIIFLIYAQIDFTTNTLASHAHKSKWQTMCERSSRHTQPTTRANSKQCLLCECECIEWNAPERQK